LEINVRAIFDYARDSIDKILIVAGVFFIFLTVPLLTPADQLLSALSLLVGVISTIIGVGLHFESFSWKIPSLQGLGTIMIYVSFVFIALAVIFAFFTLPTAVIGIPAHWSSYGPLDEHGSPFAYYTHGAPRGYFLAMITDRPTAWLAPPLLAVGLGFLCLGFILKSARHIF